MNAESNNQYKGIILAGGSGTRLYPVTQVISKQLLPVYNKPMIYYPLSVLMLSGIRDILLITTPHEQHLFKALLKDGSQWGIEIKYEVQPKPEGLAQAFIIGKSFIGDSNVTLILGDNIFYGHGLTEILQREIKRNKGATIFGYWVKDPERYGVAEVSDNFKVISIEEKPAKPRSNFAVTGLYFYDNQVVEFASNLKPSARGELEISDINNLYLKKGELRAELLGRGFAWLDTGTHESLLEASTFIETIEKRQGQQIACIEEIAFIMGYIDKQQVIKLAEPFIKNSYGQYLLNISKDSTHK
jgi:glucose-1-phosphate thymidylyltransferase